VPVLPNSDAILVVTLNIHVAKGHVIKIKVIHEALATARHHKHHTSHLPAVVNEGVLIWIVIDRLEGCPAPVAPSLLPRIEQPFLPT
jgi:hypothetical protein